MKNNTKIAMIGAGNMGQAILRGFLKQNAVPENIFVADHKAQTCEQLQSECGIKASTDNRAAAEFADYLILAVKPHQLSAILQDIQPFLKTSSVVVSVAAGVTCAQLQKFLTRPEAPVIRAMPNTPALINEGMTALCKSPTVSDTQAKIAESLFSSVGQTVWIEDENLMNVVTALSGSGPAYFFYMLESLIEGAKGLGLSETDAKKLCLQTALGSIKMAQQSASSLTALRAQVTSKGGTTEQGVQTLQANHFADSLKKALTAATLRGKALSEQEV